MIRFHYDDELDARIATYSGFVDDEDLRTAYDALLASGEFDPAMDVVSDLSEVTRYDVSAEGLRELARTFAPYNAAMAGARLAIVAPKDVIYGMARMFEILRSDAPQEIRIFRDLEEAREWIQQAHSPQERAS